jgi:hypothetical protein
MQTPTTTHEQMSPALDFVQQHSHSYNLGALGHHFDDHPYPQPHPPHLVLVRSPSQPSLTNSNTTHTSDETPTTPRAPKHRSQMSSPVVSNRSLDGPSYGTLSKLATKGSFVDSDQYSLSRDDSSTFTDRRSKRLSLSRSLQNLREKADQTRRRSSVSSSK